MDSKGGMSPTPEAEAEVTTLAAPGLRHTASSSNDANTKSCCIRVKTAHKTLVVNCGTVENRLEWFTKLKNAVALSKALAENSASLFGAKSFGDALLKRKQKTRRHRESIIRTDDGVSVEIIVTHDVAMDGPGEPVAQTVGTITAKRGDCLAVVRDLIYKQLDSDDIPLYFTFLQKVADAPNLGKKFWDELKTTHATRGGNGDGDGAQDEGAGVAALRDQTRVESFGWLDRKLHGLYTKVTTVAEEKVRVGAYRHDDNRICILARDTATAGNGTTTPVATQPDLNKAPKKSPFSKRSSRAILTTGEESERCAQLQREVQSLQAQPEVRRILVSGNKDAEGALQLSPLGQFLFDLQRDGYLDTESTLSDLEEKYYDLFEPDDVSALLIQVGGPLENVVRRFCNQTDRIRKFLDGLQTMIEHYELNKARLTEPWWRKQMRDAKFMNFTTEKEFIDWGEPEPWCDDTPERYAYLMGKMRGEKNKRASMSAFMLPVPTAEAREAARSAKSASDASAPRPSSAASAASSNGRSSGGRPKIAFGAELKKKVSSSGSVSAAPKAGFLGAIAGFDKTALKKAK